METIDAIEKTEKKRIVTRMDGSKMVKNITNYGIKKDECAMVGREGIYYGLTIQALESHPPLMTTVLIIDVLKLLENGDIVTAFHSLHVDSPQELYYALYHWLNKYEFPIPELIEKNYVDLNNEKLLDYVNLDSGDTLPFKFKIVDIGTGKEHTVVPESWYGRIFDNADELHTEMSQLEWRKDEPPVRWCCTFNMLLKSKQIWKTRNDVISQNSKYGIRLHSEGVTFTKFTPKTYSKWFDGISNTTQYIQHSSLIIACNKQKYFNQSPTYDKEIKMSVLVSQLQKCYRRGVGCSGLLVETMRRIRNCKPYNLPEHNFMLVSGSKQLLWRTYISIIEDCSVYECNNDLLSLDTIFVLAMICHYDSTLQLNDVIFEKLVNTSLAIQSYPIAWNWRQGNYEEFDEIEISTNNIINSMSFAYTYMPKMKGDGVMLIKSINYLEEFTAPILKCQSRDEFIKKINKSEELLCRYEAIDMHCYPNITLLIQSSLPKKFIGLTTQQIPKIIWENISKKSFRSAHSLDPKYESILPTINEIQKYLYAVEPHRQAYAIEQHKQAYAVEQHKQAYDTEFSIDKQKITLPFEKEYLSLVNKTLQDTLYDVKYIANEKEIPKHIGRIAFLLLFGKKMTMKANGKFKSVEIIVGGDKNNPLKIKKISSKTKYEFMDDNERDIYAHHFLQNYPPMNSFVPPQAPIGFGWAFGENKKVKTQIKLNHNDIEFYVDNTKIPAFDASQLLANIVEIKESSENDIMTKIINHALYVDEIPNATDFTINLLMRYIWQKRIQMNNFTLFKWHHLKQHGNIPQDVWNIIRTRIMSDSEVFIGPVDRSGDKTQNSISYKYEGICMRMMNMLAMLYPQIIQISNFKYTIAKNVPGFTNLIDSLETHSATQPSTIIPHIKTKLWDHQRNAVEKIMNGIKKNKMGHCDASSVGSGKTLTAVAAVAKLMKHDANTANSSTGVLVLLPTDKLYKTWQDEIEKHTKKLNICTQSANGEFDNDITYNTIVITTLGRMRDHPIIHKWLYVIIDECLSVQNSDALHTEEALRQVTNSKYGVLLLSASFFRSRFNKLMYMLKMLRSGIPEEIEYLDIILNESLICNLNENTRKWITNTNYFELSEEISKKYDGIIKTTLDDKEKYTKLEKLLFSECDYIKCFKRIIKKNKTRKALIYARSKSEADKIADKIKNVTRYPDKTGKHVVVSYTEGTFGLNDLVEYDTIITRPPDADKLPQMKGRLDRPNQTSDVLQLEFILFKNTIEEAMIYKLEMAKKFHGHYIMPLADFYKLAVGF